MGTVTVWMKTAVAARAVGKALNRAVPTQFLHALARVLQASAASQFHKTCLTRLIATSSSAFSHVVFCMILNESIPSMYALI